MPADEGPGVEPVYPPGAVAIDPLADRLCSTVHGIPLRRKAECCGGQAPEGLTPECARLVSIALKNEAITIDPSRVDACREAMTKSLEGCDWVRPTSTPIPEPCRGLIQGKIAQGKPCRSMLECARGTFCAGLGPTQPGVCRAPLADGLPCGGSADTLAAFSAQDPEADHPSCTGICYLKRCAARTKEGESCVSSKQCASGLVCMGGHCTKGSLPIAGKACDGECAEGARCKSGTCIALAGTNESCEVLFDCKAGGCVKPAGVATGKCGMQCTAALPVQ
jgi:hypothetical protein